MRLLDIFRPRFQLAIGDCSSRSVSYSTRFPISLSGAGSDGRATPLCRILRESGAFFIEALDPNTPVHLNGVCLDPDDEIDPETTYGLSLDSHLVVFRIGRRGSGLHESFHDGNWDVAPRASPADRQTLPRNGFDSQSLRKRFPDAHTSLAFPLVGDACVPLADLIQSLPEVDAAAPSSEPAGPPTKFPNFGLDAAGNVEPDGEHACPSCWKAFSPGEALTIASHDALRGDPVLGPHAKRRFLATRFNSLGQALDEEGVACGDLACPHCRGRLPPSFFSHHQLILSLVGAPSSGKSYYLSVLLRLLPETLIRHFEANLQDGDPTGNAQLNEMKNRLFSATTQEDAFISKTDFEGVMYERLHRNGKLVSLPRPFVYYLQSLREGSDNRASLVFYDNAGEHFKPGISLDDSPGALHVAASSCLLFLFDPTTNRSFRKRLNRKRDPQLRTQSTDEQDTILAELGVRLKKMRGIESHERVDTPLALIVGKYDLWQSLLREGAVQPSEDRPLTPDEEDLNSRLTRDLLSQLCPTIVANAESISRNVKYFPLSSLGHSPKEIKDGPLAGKIAPHPRRLKPILATAPALWALRQAKPDLLHLTTATPAS